MTEGRMSKEFDRPLSQKDKVLVSHASRNIILTILGDPLFADEIYFQSSGFRNKYVTFLANLIHEKQFGKVKQEKTSDFTLGVQIQRNPKEDINTNIKFVICPLNHDQEEIPRNSIFLGLGEVLDIYEEENELPEGSEEIINRFISASYMFVNSDTQKSTEE
jgi:hypothetical protein